MSHWCHRLVSRPHPHHGAPAERGLDGTLSGRDVLRSYPSAASGLTLQASWHCTTLFRVAGKF